MRHHSSNSKLNINTNLEWTINVEFSNAIYLIKLIIIKVYWCGDEEIFWSNQHVIWNVL